LRIGVERLLAQKAGSVTTLTGKIVFHCNAASTSLRLLSMGPRTREVEPFPDGTGETRGSRNP
jgi:hypothetical protein